MLTIVSVLVDNLTNETKYMRVNELADLDEVKAIKRNESCNNEKLGMRSDENIMSQPKKKNNLSITLTEETKKNKLDTKLNSLCLL